MNAILKPFIYLGCVCVCLPKCISSMQRMEGWRGFVGAGLLLCISAVVVKTTGPKTAPTRKGLFDLRVAVCHLGKLKQELMAGTWGQKLNQGSWKNG